MTTQFVYKEDIIIPQGTDFIYHMNITDRNGDALDLTNISSAWSEMKESYFITNSTSLEIGITSPTTGRVSIGISGSVTTLLDASNYMVYDILGQTNSGSYIRLAQGKAKISPQVTSTP